MSIALLFFLTLLYIIAMEVYVSAIFLYANDCSYPLGIILAAILSSDKRAIVLSNDWSPSFSDKRAIVLYNDCSISLNTLAIFISTFVFSDWSLIELAAITAFSKVSIALLFFLTLYML